MHHMCPSRGHTQSLRMVAATPTSRSSPLPAWTETPGSGPNNPYEAWSNSLCYIKPSSPVRSSHIIHVYISLKGMLTLAHMSCYWLLRSGVLGLGILAKGSSTIIVHKRAPKYDMVTALGPKCIAYTCMDPMGFATFPSLSLKLIGYSFPQGG